MKKSQALLALGGTVSATARLCGLTPSAIRQWPEELTLDQIDRVQAALYRLKNKLPPPQPRRKPAKAAA